MGKPGTFPCLFGGEPSPLPASSRWQAWFGGSSWLSPISPMQRQGKPMRSMPRGSRQPSGGWVFWPFRRASKKGTTCLSKTSERCIFKRNKYSKKFDWDSGHQNWQCWEMLGNQWSASWRVLPIDYPRNFVSSPKILECPRQNPEKQLHPSLCTTGHHHFDGRAQLPQVGDEEVSLFFALDSEGSTCPRAKWPHHRMSGNIWRHF